MSLFQFFRDRKQFDELRREVDALKTKVNALDEEWSDYYDRFRRMMAKMAKREERAAQSDVREDAPQEGVVDDPQLSLTPSQMQIQAKILARRNRLKIAGG